MLYSIQRQLQRLYDIRVQHNVEAFVTSDRQQLVQQGVTPTLAAETLYVREQGDDLELSLFMGRKLLQRLRRDNPMRRLHGGNLAAFWVAAEGVSHFLMLCWRAGYQRRVSALEMELQAEVDKFVLAALLFGYQKSGCVAPQLHAQLFAKHDWRAEISGTEQGRYRHASEWAAKYCQGLQHAFMARVPRHGLLPELRRFYRLDHQSKLHRIRGFVS